MLKSKAALRLFEQGNAFFIIRQNSAHLLIKTGAVIFHADMCQLMHDDVFCRFFRQQSKSVGKANAVFSAA